MKNYFKKALPKRINSTSLTELIFIGVGAFVGLEMLVLLSAYSKEPLLLGSFGASIFILMATPESTFAQPRNLIGGHLVATIIGMMCIEFLGKDFLFLGIALSLTVVSMIVFEISHPPAASNPIIVYVSIPDWEFILFPTLIGVIFLLLFAFIYHKFISKRKYPKYWLKV